MDSSLTFYLVLGALLLGFIVLGMLKGMIKMLLFGAAVLSSVAAYFWLSKYGFTYLSFITSDPREWMVTVLSVGGAAAVFFVFMHGLFWFSDVFSWGRRMGFGGTKGIITTVLMAAVVCWVGVMCIFFYGSMAEMTRARELALYHMDPNRTISLPAIYSIKKSIMDNPHLSWLEKISPEHDPERLSLAKMIAYLVTLSPELSDQRRTQLAGLEGRHLLVQRAHPRPLLIVEHRTVDGAGDMILGVLGGRAYIDDRIEAVEPIEARGKIIWLGRHEKNEPDESTGTKKRHD